MAELRPEGASPLPLGPGGPEGSPQIPRETREYYERFGVLPVGGPDIIEDLQSVEIGEEGDISELEDVVNRALAYREGLTIGFTGEAYRFDPKETTASNRQKIALLENLFYTIEGATARPLGAGYVDIAIDEAVDGRIRKAQAWRRDPEKFQRRLERRLETLDAETRIRRIAQELDRVGKEYLATPKLLELKNHIHARRIFDTAFTHRMQTCEDPVRAAKLGIEFATVTPDGSHWIGIFRGEQETEFGQAVNGVFEEMVKFALPDDVIRRLKMTPIPQEIRSQVPQHIYAKGFENATMFATWLNHLLTKSGGRMDVVWNAWKLALTLEVPDRLGETREKGKWILAAPPIGNALMTFLAHLEKKRTIEYGLGAANAERIQIEKFVSHSGLPMSLDKIPNLCEDYLNYSEIEFDRTNLNTMRAPLLNMASLLPRRGDSDYNQKYEKLREGIQNWLRGKSDKVTVSLWDLWLYGRLSFASRNFPWFLTDQLNSAASPGELPPGSFGNWYLTRYRANGTDRSVLADIRSRPPLQDLGDPDYFASRLRNWTKVLGTTKPDVRPEDNPRAWWLAGILEYHFGKAGKNAPIVREEPFRDYRTLTANQEVERRSEALAGTVGTGDILHNAKVTGFIREVDEVWIKKKLGF